MIPDPSEHTPDCAAPERGQVPSLIFSVSPSRGGGTVMMRMWERCDSCQAVTVYCQQRIPWRSFHRSWKASVGVWIATWEHRYQIGSRVTQS